MGIDVTAQIGEAERVDIREVLKHSKSMNVLYVEDDISLHEQTKHLLENYFASVDSAFDGESGLRHYLDNKKQSNSSYDLVITDINMPKMNGMDMIREIFKVEKNQRAIVLSAYLDYSEAVGKLNVEFIQKPVIGRELSKLIYKVCKPTP